MEFMELIVISFAPVFVIIAIVLAIAGQWIGVGVSFLMFVGLMVLANIRKKDKRNVKNNWIPRARTKDDIIGQATLEDVLRRRRERDE